jgi:hypothetical protein
MALVALFLMAIQSVSLIFSRSERVPDWLLIGEMDINRKGDRPLVFTVRKVADQTNEDSWAWSHEGIIALSDGASISFDSAAWSKILVQHYCRCPNFSDSWLKGATAEFGRLYDREALPWMKQAAFDRGSFASLVGIQCHAGGKLQIFAVGDSLVVLCDGDEIKATFPYQNALQFDQSPQLISTNAAENGFLRDWDTSDKFCCDWNCATLKSPSVLCVTDALGQWILSRSECGDSPITILRRIRTKKAFEKFVSSERASRHLKIDDTSLIALW